LLNISVENKLYKLIASLKGVEGTDEMLLVSWKMKDNASLQFPFGGY